MLNRYNSGELWHADSIHLDRSVTYRTLRSGRPVYGGGGIMPDVFVPADTSRYSPYYRDLMAKGVMIKYTLGYIDSHRKELLRKYPTEEAFAAGYTPAEDVIAGLHAAGDEQGVPLDSAQWERSRELIEAVLKGLMLRDLYENGIYVRATNPLSSDYRTALDLIRDPRRYRELLERRE